MISGRYRWIPFILAVFVALWGLVRGVAYLNIVSQPHPYEQASRWIYANVPAQSKLLGVHWDDFLPLTLPGLEASRYVTKWAGRGGELPLYEPDTADKLALMAERLASADYLIFPTPRLPGSLMRVPDEYPFSTAMLRLLYAGQLGYNLRASFKSRPCFLWYCVNDDLADESISVYDHPKVTVFENRMRLTQEEIRRRIEGAVNTSTSPSRSQILLANSDFQIQVAESAPSPLWQVVLWLLVVELLGGGAALLLYRLFEGTPDAGFGLAKGLGVLLASYCIWLLHSIQVLHLSAASCWFVVLLLAGLAVLVRKPTNGATSGSTVLSNLVLIECLFLASFFAVLGLRAFNPEIFWGEKPMNFTFLNFFIRNDTMPPQDPWAAGQQMRYYYLGTYLMAVLHHLSGVDPRIGYNLAIATVAGLITAALCSTILLWTGKRWLSAAGAVAIVGLSNLEWVRLVFFEKMRLTFDLYWATTRLFHSPAFAEYPLWSYLFGDLHAHVVALPFVVIAIALASLLFLRSRISLANRIGLALVLGWVWGMLFGLNSWDFISMSAVIGLFWCLSLTLPSEGSMFLRSTSSLLILPVVALVGMLPFIQSTAGGLKLNYGWVGPNEFNSLSQVLRHVGIFAVPAIAATFILIWRNFRGNLIIRSILAVGFGVLPLALAAVSTLRGTASIPWGIVVTSAVLSGTSLFVALGSQGFGVRAGGAAIAAGSLLIGGAELVFLMDRMNTIFKCYNSIWILLGLGAVVMLYGALSASTPKVIGRLVKAACLIVSGLLASVALTGSLINVQIMTSFQRVEGPRPTLDGGAYLKEVSADEASLFEWINREIKGTPVLLEAHGPSYGPFTRVAMHTGLPVVLGWEYHVIQRGTPVQEMWTRRSDVHSIYRTLDMKEALGLLNKYNVSWLVVGDLERRLYSPISLSKFEYESGFFEKVFTQGRVSLYRVKCSCLSCESCRQDTGSM